jgi:hypothetical protein
MNTVKKLVKRDRRFKSVDIEFLQNERVEIDAILSQVGGERLWHFIQDRLVKQYPKRDYNRAITTPAVETLYQEPLQELLTFVNEYHSELVSNKEDEIIDTLSDTAGMIDIDEKKKEIQSELQKVVDVDDGVKVMSDTMKKLLDELRKKKKKK